MTMVKKERRIIIELDNVFKHFRMGNNIVKAVDGISFKIREGDFVAIMGPSGSGKSTLMNLVGSLDVPTKGKVFLDGRLEEVKCEDGDSDDINAACNFDNECGQFVFGELGLVKRISSPSSSQAGNIIDFVPINKKAIAQLKHKLITIPLTKNHWVDPNLDRSSINNLVSSNRNFERYNSIPYSIWAISFYERLKRAKQTLDDFGHIKISHQF